MKISSKGLLAAVFSLSVISTGGHAAVEDLNGHNSTYNTAQYVGDLSAVTLINVFGFRGSVFNDNSDADFYSFQLTQPATVKLNVFTPGGSTYDNDPVLGLYDAAGTLLAAADDGGAGWDSLLEYVLNTSGIYIAAVSGYLDSGDGSADFSFTGGGDTNFSYNLQAEVLATAKPVPLPASVWLLASSLLGLMLGRRRPV